MDGCSMSWVQAQISGDAAELTTDMDSLNDEDRNIMYCTALDLLLLHAVLHMRHRLRKVVAAANSCTRAAAALSCRPAEQRYE
jgi:hypothetical protein